MVEWRFVVSWPIVRISLLLWSRCLGPCSILEGISGGVVILRGVELADFIINLLVQAYVLVQVVPRWPFSEELGRVHLHGVEEHLRLFLACFVMLKSAVVLLAEIGELKVWVLTCAVIVPADAVIIKVTASADMVREFSVLVGA